MGEDFDLKDALHKHVTRHEPPFALTADQLIAAGHKQGRWRMTSGAASVAAVVVAITGALTILGPGGRPTSLSDSSCALPLAAGWSPPPSSGVVELFPSGAPLWLTPDPSQWPTAGPSQWPTAGPSQWPTAGPSQWPTTGPSQWPTAGPSGWPGSTPTAGLGPSGSPGGTPTPGDDPWPTGWPTVAPVPTDPPPARVAAATCYLARELQAMFPDARYAPVLDRPPMFVHKGRYGYLALGTIVGKDGPTHLLLEIVQQSIFGVNGLPGGKERDGKNYLSRADGRLSTVVYTGYTGVYLVSSGPMLTLEQVERIATAPELDIWRP